ncbi:MAG TPA: YfiR family protein [Terriglobia bacterium]|jgi:hypothetical protein
MRVYCRRAAAAVAAICLILGHSPASVSQAGAGEYQVKAAFLYNFAKFVDWPPQAFARGGPSFTICLAGDPFAQELDKIVQGEVLDNRPLMVRRLAHGEDMRGCQMIYIASEEAKRSAEILKAVDDDPILTVGESDDFIDNGGIIRFIKTGGRIHFQINPDAAERVSLKISARLLRLAEIVRPRPRQRAGVL